MLMRATIRAVIASLLLVTSLRAQVPLSTEWFGTWNLDVARSTFVGPAPYKRGTWTVARGPADQISMVYHQVGTRGGVTHMEWTGMFDGADRRLHGPDAVVTYAYTVVSPTELRLQVKIDGRVAATSRVVLGPATTVTATTENATPRGPVTTVTVYTKR